MERKLRSMWFKIIQKLLPYSAFTKTITVSFGLERTKTEPINLMGQHLKNLHHNEPQEKLRNRNYDQPID